MEPLIVNQVTIAFAAGLLLLLLLKLKATQEPVTIAIKWLFGVFTESDGNGGKPSIARIIGAVAVWNIITYPWATGDKLPPEMWWDVFMIALGYSMLSKALASVSPAIIDLAKGYMNKHTKGDVPEKRTTTTEESESKKTTVVAATT